MPDNVPSTPGSATSSAGSTTTGQAAPAGQGTAGQGAPVPDPAEARLKALIAEAITPLVTKQENLRSLHDRQMQELRQTVLLPRPTNGGDATRATADPAYGPTAGAPPPAPSMRDQYMEQDLALIKFRQLHPDWADYWQEMEPILNDRDKAAPFAIYRPDTSIDYYRSIEYLKHSIERSRLLKRQQEFEQSRANAEANRETTRRDAVVSGQSASTVDMAEWSKLSRKEKMQRLYKERPDLFDPEDLPEDLRS